MSPTPARALASAELSAATRVPWSTAGVEVEATDPKAFRDAMGRLATGVTVITMATPEACHGMTANAVMSLSLEPPLVAVAIGLGSYSHELIRESGRLTINVLPEGADALALDFARRGAREAHLFGGEVRLGPTGDPLLDGALVHLCCVVRSVYEEGDHALVVARVTSMILGDAEREPLLFFRGRFGSLARGTETAKD